MQISTIHTTRQFLFFKVFSLSVVVPYEQQPTGSRLMSESNEIMLTDR